MDEKIEIHVCIKSHTIDAKQIFGEMFDRYGLQSVSMRTVFRWVKAFNPCPA